MRNLGSAGDWSKSRVQVGSGEERAELRRAPTQKPVSQRTYTPGASPLLAPGPTCVSASKHAVTVVPTVSRLVLTIKSQAHRRAYMVSNDNIFKHDVPRGHADSQAWAKAGGWSGRRRSMPSVFGNTGRGGVGAMLMLWGANRGGQGQAPPPRTSPPRETRVQTRVQEMMNSLH